MNDDMLHPAVSSVPASRLTCAQCERMVQDAVDGTLLRDDQVQFDLHLAGCAGCRRIYDDALDGLSFLADLKQEIPEPPSLLLTRILAETSGNPAVAIPVLRNEPLLAGARGSYPAGHLATVLPFQPPIRRTWPARVVHAAMQPRFAMTAAMAFFSIALTMNLLGISPRDFHSSSLRPANLRHSFWSAHARVVRSYDNLRIVYELESRVNEIRQTDDERQPSKPEPPRKEPEKPAPDGSHSQLHRSGPPPRQEHAPRRNASTLLPTSPATHPLTASAAGNRGEGATA